MLQTIWNNTEPPNPAKPAENPATTEHTIKIMTWITNDIVGRWCARRRSPAFLRAAHVILCDVANEVGFSCVLLFFASGGILVVSKFVVCLWPSVASRCFGFLRNKSSTFAWPCWGLTCWMLAVSGVHSDTTNFFYSPMITSTTFCVVYFFQTNFFRFFPELFLEFFPGANATTSERKYASCSLFPRNMTPHPVKFKSREGGGC